MAVSPGAIQGIRTPATVILATNSSYIARGIVPRKLWRRPNKFKTGNDSLTGRT